MSKYIDYQAWELIKKNLFNSLHPIGEVITNGLSSFDPNIEYPGTKWERIKGRVIVGVDENDSDFNTVNKTSGAKTHTLTIEQMPSHNHKASSTKSILHDTSISDTNFGWHASYNDGFKSLSNIDTSTLIQIGTNGGSQAHNNLQPYITKYVWQRIA